MANWISITTETLYEARVAKLIDAASQRARADGQPERVDGLIQGVVTEIRRKIASNEQNRLDANPATLPASLRDMAVDLIIARLKKSIERELTEDERRDLRVHETNLNRIADGDDPVESPDNPIESPVQSSSGTPRVAPPAKLEKWEDGL